MSERWTAVSLFAGVGGIDLALERAGVDVVAAVEIDDAARGVLADRFPKTRLFRDVTEVTGDDLRRAGFVPERGVVAAGWPCQGNSVAGRRGGMADPRSGLWRHVVRLLAETRARWFLGENVPGLLSVNDGDDFGVVVHDLGTLGYGGASRVLDAQFFGVPQRRRRVFFVGCLGDQRRPVEVLAEPEGGGGNPPAGRAAGQGVAATLTRGTSGSGVSAPGRRQEDDINLVVSVAENQRGEIVTAGVTQALNRGGGKPGQGYPLAMVVQPVALRGREDGAELELSEVGSPAHALRTPAGGSSHGMVAVSATGDRSHTLTAEGHDASDRGPSPSAVFIATETVVRRLTPLECERLQGFPDNWTATSNGKPQADSARYRQMGNAVAVPCVEWIARRMTSPTTHPIPESEARRG
jgi:DNA (cytosine-5)-methyltransferase 1